MKALRKNRQRNTEKNLAKAAQKGVHRHRVSLRKAIYEAMNVGDYHRARALYAELHPGKDLPFALRPFPTVDTAAMAAAVIAERLDTQETPVVEEVA